MMIWCTLRHNGMLPDFNIIITVYNHSFAYCVYCTCFSSLGANVHSVEQMVEDHLKTLLIKHFDPKKADSIFTGEVRKLDQFQAEFCINV